MFLPIITILLPNLNAVNSLINKGFSTLFRGHYQYYLFPMGQPKMAAIPRDGSVWTKAYEHEWIPLVQSKHMTLAAK